MGTGIDKEMLDMVLAAVKDFASANLQDDKLLALDRTEEFPTDIISALYGEELGVQLLFIDEEHGGMGGGAFDVTMICELLASIDLGIATAVLATFLGADPIKYGGTPEQRMRWMSRVAEEGLLMAYGATEPAAGSDLGALRTTARHVLGDQGELEGYLINGAKQWISNGGYADLYTVLAKAPGGPSWFVVEKGAKGMTPGKPEEKHGIRASNTSAIAFDDVFVTPDCLVGGVEGQGLIQAQMVFGYTRLMVAGFGLGAGWAALDRAIPYSVDRLQGGAPLSEKQGFTHKLIVPWAVRLEAGRAYIEETAVRIDSGEGRLNTDGAIAKYLATEAGNGAAEAAIQALGGYGYTHEYMVEKIRRDVRITTIYEGTSEIMEMTISRDRWKDHLVSRGEHYHDLAAQAEALHSRHPDVGADISALALHAMANVMERCRTGRLTREQHVLMRLGELIAWAEGAACLSRRAAMAKEGTLHEKASRRFDAPTLAAMARIFAREAAVMAGEAGLKWVVSTASSGDIATLEREFRLTDIHRVQAGLLADMNTVADALYGRSGA